MNVNEDVVVFLTAFDPVSRIIVAYKFQSTLITIESLFAFFGAC